jgi:hypothetical protein
MNVKRTVRGYAAAGFAGELKRRVQLWACTAWIHVTHQAVSEGNVPLLWLLPASKGGWCIGVWPWCAAAAAAAAAGGCQQVQHPRPDRSFCFGVTEAFTKWGVNCWYKVKCPLLLLPAAGILIEDQVSPKSCGHVRGKRVVSREEAVSRIRAAADAR